MVALAQDNLARSIDAAISATNETGLPPGAVSTSRGIALPDNALNQIAKHKDFIEYIIPEAAKGIIEGLVPGNKVNVEIQVVMRGLGQEKLQTIGLPGTYELAQEEVLGSNLKSSGLASSNGPVLLPNDQREAIKAFRFDLAV